MMLYEVPESLRILCHQILHVDAPLAFFAVTRESNSISEVLIQLELPPFFRIMMVFAGGSTAKVEEVSWHHVNSMGSTRRNGRQIDTFGTIRYSVSYESSHGRDSSARPHTNDRSCSIHWKLHIALANANLKHTPLDVVSASYRFTVEHSIKLPRSSDAR